MRLTYEEAKNKANGIYSIANNKHIRDVYCLQNYVTEIRNKNHLQINKNYVRNFKTGKNTFVIELVQEVMNVTTTEAVKEITGIDTSLFFKNITTIKKQDNKIRKIDKIISKKEDTELDKINNFILINKEKETNIKTEKQLNKPNPDFNFENNNVLTQKQYRSNKRIILNNIKEDLKYREEEIEKLSKIDKKILIEEIEINNHKPYGMDYKQKTFESKIVFYNNNIRGISRQLIYKLINDGLILVNNFGIPIYVYKNNNEDITGGEFKYFKSFKEKQFDFKAYEEKQDKLNNQIEKETDKRKIEKLKKESYKLYKDKPKRSNCKLRNSKGCFKLIYGNKEDITKIYVFEAVVDLLSFITIYENNKNVINNSIFIATSGAFNLKDSKEYIEEYLQNGNLKIVYTCQDSDEVGDNAAEKLKNDLKGTVEVRRVKSTKKDWNLQLMLNKGLDLNF